MTSYFEKLGHGLKKRMSVGCLRKQCFAVVSYAAGIIIGLVLKYSRSDNSFSHGVRVAIRRRPSVFEITFTLRSDLQMTRQIRWVSYGLSPLLHIAK